MWKPSRVALLSASFAHSLANVCFKSQPPPPLPESHCIWIINVWGVREGFFPSFFSIYWPWNFWLAKLFIYSNVTDLEDIFFFFFLRLFHEFKVKCSEAPGVIAETIRAKGLSRTKISKGFFFFLVALGPFSILFFWNMLLCSCLFLPTCGCMFLKQRRHHLFPPLIAIPDRLLLCQAACPALCVCLSVCDCSACTLLDLCSSYRLAWRRHETKSVTPVKGICIAFRWAVLWFTKIVELLKRTSHVWGEKNRCLHLPPLISSELKCFSPKRRRQLNAFCPQYILLFLIAKWMSYTPSTNCRVSLLLHRSLTPLLPV